MYNGFFEKKIFWIQIYNAIYNTVDTEKIRALPTEVKTRQS